MGRGQPTATWSTARTPKRRAAWPPPSFPISIRSPNSESCPTTLTRNMANLPVARSTSLRNPEPTNYTETHSNSSETPISTRAILFSPTRGEFIQNQFGGIIGGPIVRQKVFFFSDYQGTRQIQGVPSGLIPVPSTEDLMGNLADQATSLTGVVGGPCSVAGQCLADQLTQKLGYTVSVAEPYYTPTCADNTQCVFPGAIIPQARSPLPLWPYRSISPATPTVRRRMLPSRHHHIIRFFAMTKSVSALMPTRRWGTIFGYYCSTIIR